MFNIRDHIDFDHQNRAYCPCCDPEGIKKGKRTLSVGETGAYKCFRGCTTDEIRNAIGEPKNRQIPSSLARSPVHHPIADKSATTVTISPQKVKESHERLKASDRAAKAWLHQRGISDALIDRYQLGLSRAKVGSQHLPAISIPIPNHDGTAYYQKKRVAPWLPEAEQPQNYYPWSQKGIPAKVWFTWLPTEANQTFLCEGEWDAMLLGAMMRQAEQPIAVASFTCGCSSIPPQEQLNLLPGRVTIFYDRNDKPNKQGLIPGEHGAQKLAEALGDRAAIGLVPMPDGCTVKGWDVGNAIANGSTLQDFLSAAGTAKPYKPPQRANPLRDRLTWNDELIANAPDYTDWLVPDLLTANELFVLASGPRMGKSLMAMSLARSVAAGEPFLDRPVMQGVVLYICLEDSPAKIKERETAQQWAEGLPVVWLNKFKLSEMEDLKEIIQELDPRLVILDTLSRVRCRGNSENSSDIHFELEPLQEMAKELETCILLVHHTGKISIDNAAAIDIFDTIRGSGSIRGVCRGSLIIAAGERDFRLVAENGWGKHDLKILLDANSLHWRLLGKWNPTVNSGQSQQVIEYLKTVENATLDEIYEVLQIPKMSLYKVLERLQASDVAEEKIVKYGNRRNYRYSLSLYHSVKPLASLFDKPPLSNSLSNSANPDSSSDTGYYLTNSTFFPETGSIIDHLDARSTRNTNSDDHLNLVVKKAEPAHSNTLKPNDHFRSDPADSQVVKYRHLQGSSPGTEPDPLFDTLFDKGGLVKYTDGEKSDHSDIVLQDQVIISDHPNVSVQVGDIVVILGTALWIRKGSDTLDWQKLPHKSGRALSIPIANMDLSLFHELTTRSEVIRLKEWDDAPTYVTVRSQETGRVATFRLEDVCVLQKGGES
jgi:hypothetical protein